MSSLLPPLTRYRHSCDLLFFHPEISQAKLLVPYQDTMIASAVWLLQNCPGEFASNRKVHSLYWALSIFSCVVWLYVFLINPFF